RTVPAECPQGARRARKTRGRGALVSGAGEGSQAQLAGFYVNLGLTAVRRWSGSVNLYTHLRGRRAGVRSPSPATFVQVAPAWRPSPGSIPGRQPDGRPEGKFPMKRADR